MGSISSGFRAASIVAFAVLLAGCSVNMNFAYKPNPLVAGAQKIPVKVAVLPFADGTEDFTMHGSTVAVGGSASARYNLAKTGVAGVVSALPPELWGKSFADELSASGSFRSVRFIYSPSEAKDESILVGGVLKKAVHAQSINNKNEILVSFRATGWPDGKIFWEKEAGRVWNTPEEVSAGCATGMQCLPDRMHEIWNHQMRAVFAEALADLVAAIGSPDGGAARDAAGEPLDRAIEKILKTK